LGPEEETKNQMSIEGSEETLPGGGRIFVLLKGKKAQVGRFERGRAVYTYAPKKKKRQTEGEEAGMGKIVTKKKKKKKKKKE